MAAMPLFKSADTCVSAMATRNEQSADSAPVCPSDSGFGFRRRLRASYPHRPFVRAASSVACSSSLPYFCLAGCLAEKARAQDTSSVPPPHSPQRCRQRTPATPWTRSPRAPGQALVVSRSWGGSIDLLDCPPTAAAAAGSRGGKLDVWRKIDFLGMLK
jgi:hypothetical protein